MCLAPEYCPDDNVTYPCMECFECLEEISPSASDIRDGYLNIKRALALAFGESNVKSLNPYHGIHQEECEDLPF